MNKTGKKCRDVRFRSLKNNQVMCVHTEAARAYARILEEDSQVASYEAGFALDRERYQFVSPLDIRKEYFMTDWATDFVLHYADGRIGIRELLPDNGLEKRSEMEKLEFSRRYWSNTDVADWKIVIMEKGV